MRHYGICGKIHISKINSLKIIAIENTFNLKKKTTTTTTVWDLFLFFFFMIDNLQIAWYFCLYNEMLVILDNSIVTNCSSYPLKDFFLTQKKKAELCFYRHVSPSFVSKAKKIFSKTLMIISCRKKKSFILWKNDRGGKSYNIRYCREKNMSFSIFFFF